MSIQSHTEQASAPSDQDGMEKAAHTPTPWELSAENPRLIMKDVPGMSDGFDQFCIAEAHYHGLLGHKEAQANAAFIVKAVNSHDALVKALHAVIDAACDYLPPDGITKDEFINRVIAATDNAEFNAAFTAAAA